MYFPWRDRRLTSGEASPRILSACELTHRARQPVDRATTFTVLNLALIHPLFRFYTSLGSGRFWTPLLRFEFDPDERADVAVPAVVAVVVAVAVVLGVGAVTRVVRIPPSAMPTFPAGHETPLRVARWL